jgi:hypothetical protein
MTLRKQITAKKAWARLSERAESGETFGFIAALSLLYKSGVLKRGQVTEQLNLAHVTRDDLRKFREHTNSGSNRQSGSVSSWPASRQIRQLQTTVGEDHAET